MQESSQTEFYKTTYDSLYDIGYHQDPDYTHSFHLVEWLRASVDFETVVDVGCSQGAAIALLQKRGKYAVGLDPSLVAINKANAQGRPAFRGVAQDMPFPDNYADVVMSTDVMEHLRREDVDAAISECFRVAKSFIAMKIASYMESGGWGQKVGVPNLHLTIQPIEWWKAKFLSRGGELIYDVKDTFVLKLDDNS